MNAPSFAWAEAYLLGTIDETVSRKTSYKLDRIRALLRELGDPHLAYPVVHIGGTSGKGSTCTLVAAALQAAGLRTGLHTKPHLRSATERACVDGAPIAPERFAETLHGMLPAIARVSAQLGAPSYYETLLALALVHFAAERVDAAVVEVGLGGRLDGTNVLVPVVSAITSVGYDHTDVLGDTLEQIAREKGGIAKPGVPLVVAPVPPPAAAVLEDCAREAGAPLSWVEQWVRIERPPDTVATAQRFDAVTERGRYRIALRARGAFQIGNAATAIAILEHLPADLRPPGRAVEDGFAAAEIPGRMDVVDGVVPIVFDIAHNPEKAEALTAALASEFPGRRVHYVVAIGESKDARRILERLLVLPGSIVTTAFEVPGRRAIAPVQLAAMAAELGRPAAAVEDVQHALRRALDAAAGNDVVVVTGSTFVVAAARDAMAEVAGARGA